LVLYRVAAHHLWGRTLGKLLCSILVVSRSAMVRPSLRHSLIRESVLGVGVISDVILTLGLVMTSFSEPIILSLAALAGLIAVVWYLGNLLAILFQSSGLTYYDRWFGTAVIRVSSASAGAEQKTLR
jgi:uncharacterized RDD family membrane protein YckC